MHKVEFKIHHRSCWGSDIGLTFPTMSFSSVDCRWVQGKVAHILCSRGNSKEFRSILGYLKKRNDVLSAHVLSEDDQTSYIRVLTKKDVHTSQFSDMFFEHGCFPVAPVRFEQRYEVWTLGATQRSSISSVYKLLSKHHPVRISYLKEELMDAPLTQKQREVLTYAKHFGYYEWPRIRSVTEICSMVNIPKTVFLSHLRKAENKIIGEFLSREK